MQNIWQGCAGHILLSDTNSTGDVLDPLYYHAPLDDKDLSFMNMEIKRLRMNNVGSSLFLIFKISGRHKYSKLR